MKEALDRSVYERVLVEVDRILFEDWDPIGINKEPGAFDEYTSYAPEVISLLIRGATEQVICDHLAYIEHQKMGLKFEAGDRLGVARKLQAVSLENGVG